VGSKWHEIIKVIDKKRMDTKFSKNIKTFKKRRIKFAKK
jgi:hypothetical protein